jgi:DNA/RNA endonuclease YhcR with UshA esterase domain
MSKSILTLFEAEESFLNKTIEVRGDITEYEGEPQIKIYDVSQISVVE